MAGREGFEPPGPFGPLVFKTSTLSRSDIFPYGSRRWGRTTVSWVRTRRLAVGLCGYMSPARDGQGIAYHRSLGMTSVSSP